MMHRSTPQVSVCLPSYNYAEFIRPCIDSVLKQTYPDFELCIVDDASNDNSVEIVRSYDDSRLRLHQHTTRSGAVATWNHCLELAQGEYISFVCADDFFMPDKLIRQVEMLENDAATGLVHSDGYWDKGDETGQIPFSSVFPPDVQSRLSRDHITPAPEELRYLSAGYNYIHLSNAMFRRCSALELGGFDERFPYAADWDMWLRLATRYSVAYLAANLAVYRRHSRNLTLTMQQSGQDFRDWYGVTKETFLRWPAEAGDPSPIIRQAYRVIREHLAARIHLNYARKQNREVRRGLEIGLYNDFRAWLNGHSLVTYVKALCGGRAVKRRILSQFSTHEGKTEGGGDDPV